MKRWLFLLLTYYNVICFTSLSYSQEVITESTQYDTAQAQGVQTICMHKTAISAYKNFTTGNKWVDLACGVLTIFTGGCTELAGAAVVVKTCAVGPPTLLGLTSTCCCGGTIACLGIACTACALSRLKNQYDCDTNSEHSDYESNEDSSTDSEI